jgi:hypothetical protein
VRLGRRTAEAAVPTWFVVLARKSRFLRCAVAFAPAPVGMTEWVAFAPRESWSSLSWNGANKGGPGHRRPPVKLPRVGHPVSW